MGTLLTIWALFFPDVHRLGSTDFRTRHNADLSLRANFTVFTIPALWHGYLTGEAEQSARCEAMLDRVPSFSRRLVEFARYGELDAEQLWPLRETILTLAERQEKELVLPCTPHNKNSYKIDPNHVRSWACNAPYVTGDAKKELWLVFQGLKYPKRK